MSMTPRERWLALLNGEKPDRIPTDYWATPEVTKRLLNDLSCRDPWELYDRLHIDGQESAGPKPNAKHYPGDESADIWGRRFRKVDYGTGSYPEIDNAPLAGATTVADVEAYHWPDGLDCDWDDYSHQVANLSGRRVVRVGHYEPYLLYCQLRGMEQAMMDLLIEPEIAEAILDRIFDYFYRQNQRAWELADGKADITYVAEDLGSQSGLLMGLEQIRRFILPRQKKMADLARQFGIHIFYHTDGAARDVIPDLINVTGIEILNPIQWRCPGMEREGLVRDFGDKVIFHGAIDNQQTLPFGTPQDVRDEVLESIEIFRPARWICAPCHNIQPVSPTENIVAMYETIHEFGKIQ
jgi:uroporphyrinogen decarboxylase